VNPDALVVVVFGGVVGLLVGAWFFLRSFLAEMRAVRADIKNMVKDAVGAAISPLAQKVEAHATEIGHLRAAKSDTYQRIVRLEARS
jgi:hypothetical protein